MFPVEPKEKTKKKARSPAAEASADDGPAPPPIDVLVDTIIGFLEKSTAYMRAVSNQVFQMLSGEAQESTMDLILTVGANLLAQPSSRLMSMCSNSRGGIQLWSTT